MPVYLYGVTKGGTCLVAGTLGEGPAAPRLRPLPEQLTVGSWCPLRRRGRGRGPQPFPWGAQGEVSGGDQSHHGLLHSHDAGVPKVP